MDSLLRKLEAEWVNKRNWQFTSCMELLVQGTSYQFSPSSSHFHQDEFRKSNQRVWSGFLRMIMGHGYGTRVDAWKEFEKLSTLKVGDSWKKQKPETSDHQPKKQMNLVNCVNQSSSFCIILEKINHFLLCIWIYLIAYTAVDTEKRNVRNNVAF